MTSLPWALSGAHRQVHSLQLAQSVRRGHHSRMPMKTVLADRLGLRHPIIQAPMAGGGDTPPLVAAVCEAGALGSIGAAYLTPEQIAETGRSVRALTRRPFGVNLFAPSPAPAARNPRRALERMAPWFAELGLPPPAPPAAPADAFARQLAAALESGASVFSFTFGVVPPAAIEGAKARGMLVAGTATTVDEAIALEKAGVDAVVAQGSEAGGHRGSFAGDFESSMVGTIALVPQIADAVGVPVIASGGIMDGRGIAAALALGAAGVQLGTAFLTCAEAGVPDCYKEAILRARESDTRLTRAFSGRPARGIANRFMEEVGKDPEAILPFPLQNALTRPLRTAAARAGRAEFLSLWAGQGVRLARRQTAAELVARLAEETEAIIARLDRAVSRR
jgi:nitronate monooxygenase